MKLMRTYRVWAMLGVLMLVMVLTGGVANASHSWGGYHWARTSNPFTLTVVDKNTPAWDGYRVAAMTDWSVSTVLDLVSQAGDDSQGSRRSCQAVLGKDVSCNAAYGFNGWLGLAQIWVYSDGHIAQGVVKMNDSYFDTSTYNTPAWRQYVMCQEPGHTLGLAHQDENFYNANLGSCMDYTNDPDGTLKGQLSNLHPNQHDYDQLGTIYAHLDSKSTVAASSTSSARGASDDASEFGRAIGRDANGRANLFVQDLANGQKLFTWVFWTAPGQP